MRRSSVIGAVVAGVVFAAGCAPPPEPPPRAVEVASDYLSSCALIDDGTVWCWGTNGIGQVGDGTNVERSSPVQVVGLTDAVDISVGMAHSCAVRADGSAGCWGYNFWGQLGDGTTDDALAPVEVREVDDIVQIAAAAYHTCALDGGGEVSCWGDNRSGQLGIPADGSTHTDPVTVDGLPPVVDLAAGYTHTCAIDETGGVWCWGDNVLGMLGNGEDHTSSHVPVQVVGLDDATAIDGGFWHTCAARADGTAWCWGSNTTVTGQLNGQLGNDVLVRALTPVQVVGLTDVVGVSAGLEHTCAVRAGGSAACFGRDESGQLGDGEPLESSGVPVTVAGLSRATGVTAGWGQSCAVRANGHVSCWGNNVRGLLGAGVGPEHHARPVTVWPPR